MSSDSVVTKKVKQGAVDVDYEENALVVHYEVETVRVLVDSPSTVLEVLDQRPDNRKIKIKTLTADKNMAQLASDIVEKCKYIHPSRVEEIEQLLINLRKVTLSKGSGAGNDSAGGGENRNPSKNDDRDRGDRNNRGGARRTAFGENQNVQGRPSNSKHIDETTHGREPEKAKPTTMELLPPAHMNDLDEYLEMLYQVSGKSEKEKEEGLKAQERGTCMILKLCRDVINLEQLIQNSTVMGALTRVLQEEFKKSIVLTFNILRVFLAFSNFAEMHTLMANYKIGVLTMKAIEFEIKRADIRAAEMVEREKELKDNKAAAKRQDNYSGEVNKLKKLRDKEVHEHNEFVRKQDKLLFVGFYILLNLAEDSNVERKMVKKQLSQSLMLMLNRNFEDLLILSITFLKKLSLIEENKNAMKEAGIVEKLVKLVPCSSKPLITITLRFLFNLSFDSDLREQMLKCGFVPRLIALLKTPVFRAKTLKLLYHLSVDDRCKSMFTYTDGIPNLIGMVINFPQDRLAKELAALVVNLGHNPRNNELFIANKGLNLLMDRFADKRDPLLLKIIRNISHWTFCEQQECESPELQYKYRGLWSPHIKVLLDIACESEDHTLLVELFGCLANMTVYDLPASSNWSKLIRHYSLINQFCKMLVPGMCENDLLLEIVMLISNIAADAEACKIIASSTLVGTLYLLWKDKSEDVELLLQLIHCFHRLFLHHSSREEAMYSTRIVVDIIESLQHRNQYVRDKADKLIDIIFEFDRKSNGEPGQLGKEIIRKRFETYNKVWLANDQDKIEYKSRPFGDSVDDEDNQGFPAEDWRLDVESHEPSMNYMGSQERLDGMDGMHDGNGQDYDNYRGGDSSMHWEDSSIRSGNMGNMYK